MAFGIEVLVGLAIILYLLYYYATLNFDHWEKIGVKGPKPIPIFGNLKDVVFGRINFALLMKKFYDDFKDEPLVGIYSRSSPMLIVRDPEFLRDILIKDFHAFPDRSRIIAEKNDIFSQNLLNLEYNRWKPLRSKLTPVFSSGRLRDMVYLIVDCAKVFEDHVRVLVEKKEPIECRELTARFTTDSIGVCAFGLNTNALGDEDSGFRKAGRDLMGSSLRNIIRRTFREWYPNAYRMISQYIKNPSVDFFIKCMSETMEYRKKSKVRRNDFVDHLIDFKNQSNRITDFEVTDDLLVAQAFVFFLAGFETSSTTMSNTLYELAIHQDMQDKVRSEIRDVLKDGKITYDNIKEMKYLDKVVKESLRKYPPGSFLFRVSAVPYTFKGTNITIPRDTRIVISTWAIHRDPKIYPDPEKFDPERFTEENEKSRHPMHYLAFGDGPHNCLGLRFALYQTKIGIVTLLNNFKVDVCDKTIIPYQIQPRSFIPAPVGGIQLKFSLA